MSVICRIYLNYHGSQTRKTKHSNGNLQRVSWYLHQIKKSIYKYSIYVPNQLVKILQTILLYLALQHIKVSMSLACLS